MRVISPMRTDNYAASCAVGALAFTKRGTYLRLCIERFFDACHKKIKSLREKTHRMTIF